MNIIEKHKIKNVAPKFGKNFTLFRNLTGFFITESEL